MQSRPSPTNSSTRQDPFAARSRHSPSPPPSWPGDNAYREGTYPFRGPFPDYASQYGFHRYGFGHDFFREFMDRCDRDFTAERRKAEQELMETVRRMQEEHGQRMMAEAKRRREKEAAKKAEDDAKEKERKGLQDEERARQEARWEKLLGAHPTEAEKLAVCLHSDFCDKKHQKQRFRCGACQSKRGIISFDCPYCVSSLCQLCVTKFSAVRAKAAKMPDPEVEPEPEPEPEVVPESKPATAKANAQPDKASKNSGYKKRGGLGRTRNNLTDISCYKCGRPGHLARDCLGP